MEAMQIARSRGLDLVEVAAEAKPPVCTIISYGKWKYEQSKHNKDKGKHKGGKVKEVKFRININEHDYNTKLSARASRATAIDCGYSRSFVDEISRRIVATQYKRRPPLIAKVSTRTIGWDFRYARDWRT